MGNRFERGPNGNGFDKNSAFLKSKENIASVGVTVLIVGLDPSRNGENESDPLIWTVTELKDKPETNKTAGQISLPAETRKNREGIEDNVLGALGEFCDDTLLSKYIRNHLVRVDGKWLREEGVFIGDKPADVAILIYDGALDLPLNPACPDEVAPNGWVKKSELTKDQRLRDVFRQTLELDTQEGLVKNALETYRNSPEKRLRIFPESLDSIQSFCNDREYGLDLKVMSPFALKFAEKFPVARERIFQCIKFLTESQKSSERNFQEEEGNVAELEEFMRLLAPGEYKIGIGKVTGLEMSVKELATVDEIVERKWFIKRHKGWTYNYRNVRPVVETSINGWGWWKLKRGDKLGPEFSKEWYLLFSGRIQGQTHGDDQYIIPVSKIEDLRLRVHDTGF